MADYSGWKICKDCGSEVSYYSACEVCKDRERKDKVDSLLSLWDENPREAFEELVTTVHRLHDRVWRRL